MAKQKQKTKSPGTPGRPVGVKNTTAPVTRVIPGRCARCGSSKVSRSVLASEQTHSGVIDGHAYTHILTHRRRCECGQWRMEKVYENRVED